MERLIRPDVEVCHKHCAYSLLHKTSALVIARARGHNFQLGLDKELFRFWWLKGQSHSDLTLIQSL